MTEQRGLSDEAFRFMAERAGLELTAEELESLKEIYDVYSSQLESLHQLDLGAEDLAVSYWPQWDAPRAEEVE